ncbi:IS5 family transposase [Mycobacterium sp. SM1]|uniref:IS5 family transposase n=2 Tax=Mycobacterium sp. SM1 TaxID=2816243 RepID=UPI001F279562|nr:IS5 family transposase [Mycobacterium sp. SM1]
MPVYPVESRKTSCAAAGCLCRDRKPQYPSDLSDEQWKLLRPEVEAVMAELRRGPGGRAMVHDLRAVLDAIGYVTRYGIEWRALPADFPPWRAVYAFFERWSQRGMPQRLVDGLRARLRVAWGRAPLPTAGVIDAQSVKAADTVGATTRGYDAGKKINGRKRHIVVDSLGLLLVVVVTAASMQDRDAAFRVLGVVRERFSMISLVWADGGYAGRLVDWAKSVLALTVQVVKRSDDMVGFTVLPRRWVVERTFGWMLRYRRLVRDYERRPDHHEAMVLWVNVTIMTRKLHQATPGARPNPRWGRPRTGPPAPIEQAA